MREFGGTVVQTSNVWAEKSSGHLFPFVVDAAPELLNINGASIPEYLQFTLLQPSVGGAVDFVYGVPG